MEQYYDSFLETSNKSFWARRERALLGAAASPPRRGDIINHFMKKQQIFDFFVRCASVEWRKEIEALMSRNRIQLLLISKKFSKKSQLSAAVTPHAL